MRRSGSDMIPLKRLNVHGDPSLLTVSMFDRFSVQDYR